MHHRQIESLHQLVDAYLSDCRHRRDGGDLTNSTLVTYEARRRRANLPDIAQARRMQAKDRRHHRGDNLMLARETSVAAACETICFTGARSGAVRLLQRTHVNVRTRTAVVHTKGADRTIVLSAAALDILERRIELVANHHAFLFPGGGAAPLTSTAINIGFKRIAGDIYSPGQTPHGLRHAFVRTLRRHGVPWRQIADIVGHESEETTRTSYGDGSPELGSFAAADLFASIVGGAT